MANFREYAYAIFRRLCHPLPVNPRKVVFCSYYGRGYSDSPKAIAEALLSSGEKRKLQWLVKTPEDAKELPQGVEPVPYDSFRRIYALSTAKIWVDNCRKGCRGKKKSQYYLQTWHGFALKRIEKDAERALEPAYVQSCKNDSAQCDLIVSGSDFMTKLYQNAFWYDGEVAAFGTPRNDVFFQNTDAVKQKVFAALGLKPTRRLLLYAPTFRVDHSTDAYKLDVENVLAACEKRFGGCWTALIRLHPNVAEQSKGLFAYDETRVLDATRYPDMQELLLAADLLITDYSSSMFDYALSGKPCLQFATDVEAYKTDRNFYFPIDSLPFPLADSNAALCREILAFDEEVYRKRWAAFYKEQGFCEDGQAAKRCADWILQKMAE